MIETMMLTKLFLQRRPSSLLVASYAMILLCAFLPLQAQETSTREATETGLVPPGETAVRFAPAGKYALDIDGQAIPDAQAYLSLAAGSAVLVEAQELTSAVLLRPGEKRVDRVRGPDLQRQAAGAVLLADDADLELVGTYQIEAASLVWRDGDRQMRLRERPMLGLHDVTKVAAWDPEYARRASRYSPSQATLDTLRQTAGTARVRVYFGTWCPRCGQAVPKLMRLTSELQGSDLQGSDLQFEYFGMPKLEEDATDSFWREAKEAGAYQDEVNLVPLVVVYRGDRRIGRITTGWSNPERELEKILVGDDAN